MVWVVGEALRGDALAGAHPLPAVDGLTDARVFERVHASATWTLPAMATLLTGQPPWEHRVLGDVLSEGRFGVLPWTTTTVAETWSARGFRTAAWVSGPELDARLGLDQGFAHYDHAAMGPGHANRTSASVVEAALAWLGETTEPAFLVLHLPDTGFNHAAEGPCRGRYTEGLAIPFELPVPEAVYRRWRAQDERQRPDEVAFLTAVYAEDVCAQDLAIGALLEGLESQGRRTDAQIMITGDHGYELWDNGNVLHGHGVQSALTHVPLLVIDPRLEPGHSETVLGHAEVVRGLTAGAGEDWQLLASEQESGRKAFTSSPSRTMDRLSWVDERHRAELLPDSRTMLVWDLDDRGNETGIAHTYNDEWQTWASPEFTFMLDVRDDPFSPIVPTAPWLLHVPELEAARMVAP